jgi:hypothetical protein
MPVLLYILIPVVALFVLAGAYDLNRRRRRLSGHDIDSGARATRADAEARRIPGGH